MRNPWNTRPYAPKPRPDAEKRRRDLMLYTAIFAGPVAAAVLAGATAVAAMH